MVLLLVLPSQEEPDIGDPCLGSRGPSRRKERMFLHASHLHPAWMVHFHDHKALAHIDKPRVGGKASSCNSIPVGKKRRVGVFRQPSSFPQIIPQDVANFPHRENSPARTFRTSVFDVAYDEYASSGRKVKNA